VLYTAHWIHVATVVGRLVGGLGPGPHP